MTDNEINILYIATFPYHHYNTYGKKFIEGLSESILDSDQFFCYIDGAPRSFFNATKKFNSNINILDYDQSVSGREDFLKGVNYDEDESSLEFSGDVAKQIVRWSFKGFVQIKHLKEVGTEFTHIIYLDSDISFLSKLGETFKRECLPFDNDLIAIVDRSDMKKYTETGFIAWNLQHPLYKKWVELYSEMWIQHKYQKLSQWHDCAILDCTNIKIKVSKFSGIKNLSGGGDHGFISGVLGKYFDHKKGLRKYLGFSIERVVTNKFLQYILVYSYKKFFGLITFINIKLKKNKK